MNTCVIVLMLDLCFPAPVSEGIITEQQYADCRKETDAYKKAENFLGHLMRRVNRGSGKI